MFYTLQNTIKSSPKTLSEKLSGTLSMLEWQGPLIGASPSLRTVPQNGEFASSPKRLLYNIEANWAHQTVCFNRVLHIYNTKTLSSYWYSFLHVK